VSWPIFPESRGDVAAESRDPPVVADPEYGRSPTHTKTNSTEHAVPWRTNVDRVACPEHGLQGIGLVCTHIAHAIQSGAPVGFFWGDDTDTARPDAWCRACEQALRAIPTGHSTEEWFLRCDYKVFCAACWDRAKHDLYGRQQNA
jgi:hypothetical protein